MLSKQKDLRNLQSQLIKYSQNHDVAIFEHLTYLRAMNKNVFRFDFIWQAEKLSQLLNDDGIENQIVFKPRECSEVLTGVSQGSFEVIVDSSDFEKAKVIKDSSSSDYNIADSSEIFDGAVQIQDGRRLYSKVIFFSFAAIVLCPILFNWVAWLNYKGLKATSLSKSKKSLAKFVMFLGIVIALCEVLLLFNEFIPIRGLF